DVFYVRRIDAGTRHRMLDDVAAQFGPMRHVEGAAIRLADRRASGGNDHGFRHRRSPFGRQAYNKYASLPQSDYTAVRYAAWNAERATKGGPPSDLGRRRGEDVLRICNRNMRGARGYQTRVARSEFFCVKFHFVQKVAVASRDESLSPSHHSFDVV